MAICDITVGCNFLAIHRHIKGRSPVLLFGVERTGNDRADENQHTDDQNDNKFSGHNTFPSN